MLKTVIVNISRLLLGCTFILSGFVKTVDPLGTQYKLEDYAVAMGFEGIFPTWVFLCGAVLMALFECMIGIQLLFAINRRVVSKLSLAFMLVMTCLTVWIYFENPVEDCGCFGDAIKLTNGQTLAKNIVLLACAAIVACWPKKMPRMISLSRQWIVFHYSVLFFIALALHCIYHLPVFDYRPYHISANIAEGMEIPEGAEAPVYETTFIMEKDGKQEEFSLENYPDSTWTFVDSKSKLIKAGYEPPIHDFFLQDSEGEDYTDAVLSKPGYTFLLVAHDITTADDTNFGTVNTIYDYATQHNIPFYCLTASEDKAVDHWIDITGAEYPFLNCDGLTLKTIIRSNPGLVLLKEGTVAAKWGSNDLPALTSDTKIETLDETDSYETGKWETWGFILLWYILPLTILAITDRLWAWSRSIRHAEHKHSYKLINLFKTKNKKPMRKKIVAGNWKMNKNLQEGVALAKELTEVVKNPNCDVIIGTPFIHLASVAEVIKGSCIKLAAENCADKASGAYTGEVSAEMVKSTGAEYVILGHSERREYYNETPEILKEKVELALANGLKVIFCIGESLAEREANKQNEVVKAELAGSVFHLTAEQWKNIIIAYEPIWAIGTGKTATAEQAEEIHAYIRSCVAEVYGAQAADDTTILYGGSCKASNAPELFAKADIDGGLIGGASLKAADFKGIIDAWN